MSSVVRGAGWLARLHAMDPINVYIGFTGFGIVWVLALGRAFYYNPMTQDKTTIWGMFSYSFIKPWMIRFPSDAPKMKLKDLLVEDVSGGKEPRVSIFRRRFLAQWSKDKSTSRAIFRIMLPWWIFTHALQIPRKVTEFMPTLVIPHILRFLQDPSVPRTLGYKLILLSALRTVVEKSAQALYLFSASNEGTQPAILGAQTAMLQKLHTMSPRARVASSASEIQTVFAKMEGFTAAISMPGQARVLIDLATLPAGYYFLHRLFGLPAVVVSIGANVGISAVAARVTTQKTVSERKLRELRKKQEGVLNDLATNLPIWKFYGWTNFFIAKLNRLTDEMETTGRWNALWKTLAEVLPNCIGPTAVLISVGINVLRGGLGGGSQFLSKLLQAGSIISIISRSMQSLTESRQQWKDLCVECKNIDRVLSRPDSEPLSRTPDGSLRLKNASFGWPIKPPTTYTVKAADTAITAVGQDATAPPPLQKGDVVESVDGQKKGRDQVRVRLRRADPAAPPSEEEKGAAQDGWVKVSALAKNPEAALADWPAPKLGVVDLDLCITQGELVLVSGPVAAGKSTLLQSLVGNTESLGGEMSVPQSVAFQPQSPILFDQTIRANILFGIADEDANEEFIQRSLEASTLSLDMDDSESTLHAKRELTRAGQGGSSLSGGQRARVALARCIYAALAGSECLILDDPIKALDPATAAQCWDHGIKGTMEGKTRILVVNSQMLQRFASDSAVSRLIIVENEGDGTPGRITYNGLPSELPTSVQERLGDGYSMSAAQPSTTEKARDTASTVGKDGGSATAVKPSKDKAKADSGAKEKSVAKKKPKKEDKEAGDTDKGNVPTAVANYCWRMGAWLLVSSTGMFTNQAGHLALYAWYGKWASDAFGFGFRSNYAIAIFVMLGTQLTRLFQGLTDGVGGELASKSIRVDVNQKLKVLAMPYLWDPQHSTAQLTDLVTKDPNEYRIFSMLPLLLSSAAFSIGTVLYARPVIAPFAVACLGCYKYVKKPFGWSIRQVYGGVILEAWISMRKFSGELFDASPTIRAMGRQPEFDTLITSKYYQRFQLSPLFFGGHGRSNFYQMIVDTFWASISMAVVIGMRGGQLAPEVVIALYHQLEELNGAIGSFWTYNDAAAQQLPNWMKVQDFLKATQCVGKSCVEEDNRPPPKGWPEDGSVELDDIYFDYRNDAPCALNGVSVTIESGQKIGVCGRTGAGKSTMISVLFSLGPLKSGKVTLGGHDLAGISCHDVRAQVAIVPQSPTLFDGTVRENLVGGNRDVGDDASLLETLRTCRLDIVAERGLDGVMGKLSDGQRQLFCVARALVRRPKILVLDESTADLDQDSANELLRVIDANFRDTTVISIAHRLNFIRNSDKILVLNTGGTINAFDTPERLLEDKEGYFATQLAEENSGM